jgi:hypothetical protein
MFFVLDLATGGAAIRIANKKLPFSRLLLLPFF